MTVLDTPSTCDEVKPDLSVLALLMAGGDKTAFGQIYVAMIEAVLRFVTVKLRSRGCYDTQQAESLAEEVFIRAWSNINKFDPGEGKFENWVFGIARNVAFEYLNDPYILVELEDSFPDGNKSVPDEVYERVEYEKIHAILATLPEGQRVPLSEQIATDEPASVIARRLGKPESTVRDAIRVGKKAIRFELERRELIR